MHRTIILFIVSEKTRVSSVAPPAAQDATIVKSAPRLSSDVDGLPGYPAVKPINPQSMDMGMGGLLHRLLSMGVAVNQRTVSPLAAVNHRSLLAGLRLVNYHCCARWVTGSSDSRLGGKVRWIALGAVRPLLLLRRNMKLLGVIGPAIWTTEHVL